MTIKEIEKALPDRFNGMPIRFTVTMGSKSGGKKLYTFGFTFKYRGEEYGDGLKVEDATAVKEYVYYIQKLASEVIDNARKGIATPLAEDDVVMARTHH